MDNYISDPTFFSKLAFLTPLKILINNKDKHFCGFYRFQPQINSILVLIELKAIKVERLDKFEQDSFNVFEKKYETSDRAYIKTGIVLLSVNIFTSYITLVDYVPSCFNELKDYSVAKLCSDSSFFREQKLVLKLHRAFLGENCLSPKSLKYLQNYLVNRVDPNSAYENSPVFPLIEPEFYKKKRIRQKFISTEVIINCNEGNFTTKISDIPFKEQEIYRAIMNIIMKFESSLKSVSILKNTSKVSFNAVVQSQLITLKKGERMDCYCPFFPFKKSTLGSIVFVSKLAPALSRSNFKLSHSDVLIFKNKFNTQDRSYLSLYFQENDAIFLAPGESVSIDLINDGDKKGAVILLFIHLFPQSTKLVSMEEVLTIFKVGKKNGLYRRAIKNVLEMVFGRNSKNDELAKLDVVKHYRDKVIKE